MKTKSFFSLLLLLVFAILGAGSVDDNGNIEEWVLLLFLAIIIFSIIVGIISNEQEEERKKRHLKFAEEKKRELEAKTEEYNELKQHFLTTNGTPDKSIIIKKLDINSEIHVWEMSKKVFIMGKEFEFKDVMSCTFSDNPRVIKGKVTAVTKSKNGSVIGRSIVGDLVAGPAGAIIGGTTAKKHTEFHQENDRTIHDYTVIININSISEPIIRIHTDNDGKLTNEIVGLMNVIIARK